MHDDISKAAAVLGAGVDNLREASKATTGQLKRFGSLVSEFWAASEIGSDASTDNVDLVVHGSLARHELTRESDSDYIVLQHGCAPDVTRTLLIVAERAARELDLLPPGRQGVFGDIVIAANLYERIGLEADSNQNLTHRLLLLTESDCIRTKEFKGETYNAVIENTLSRYCADYLTTQSGDIPAQVPLHLLNDLVRFWRTMAVDFGAKRWRSSKNESELRLIKLRTTRKILFAGPLASLLLVPDRLNGTSELQHYLRTQLTKAPLAQLASVACDPKVASRLSAASMESLRLILNDYDELIGLFNTPGFRDAVKGSGSMNALFKDSLRRCHEIADSIERNLETIFFDEPVFIDRVRRYGLF